MTDALIPAVAYAERHHGCNLPDYRDRIVEAFRKGQRGDENPWALGRGGNYAAGLRAAYEAGTYQPTSAPTPAGR